MLDNTFVKYESTCSKTITWARMTTIENRHIVLFSHLIDSRKKRKEVFLCIYIFLTMCWEQNVLSFLQTETLVYIAGFNFGEVIVKNFCHRWTRDISAFFRQPTICKISSRMLWVRHIYIANYINDTTVGLFGKTLVFTTVSSFHMKDRNMQTFCTNNTQTWVGITKYKNSIRFCLRKEFIGTVDDITTSGS